MMMAKQKPVVVIVVSRWNEIITDLLKAGARRVLEKDFTIEEVDVPGAFEIPLAVGRALKRSDVVGAVALGAVMKGSTTHNEHIAESCFQGLMQAQMTYLKPVGCGVLTLDTLEQGFERAGGKLGNKGDEAARAVVMML